MCALVCIALQVLDSGKAFASSNKLINFCAANNLCGYVDKLGNWIIEPRYDATYKFNKDGHALVKLNNDFNLIDHEGKLLKKVNFPHPFQHSRTSKFGLFRVQDNCGQSFGCNFGFVNQNGNWAIQPKFQKLSEFSRDGLAIASDKNKWGAINTLGRWAIPAKYRNLTRFSNDGLAAARLSSKWGLIDVNGNWLLEPRFDDLKIISNSDDHLIGAKSSNKWGFITQSGNWYIEPQFEDISDDFSDGVMVAKRNDKFGILNTKGSWNLRPQFKSVKRVSNFGIFAFNYDSKWGLYNSLTKSLITPPIFDKAPVFSAGSKFAAASINWKGGMIDEKGNWVLGPKFNTIGIANPDGTMLAGSKNKVGYVNKLGNWLVEPQYEWITYLSTHKLYELKINGSYGLSDKSGNLLLKPADSKQIKKLRIEAANFGNATNMMHLARNLVLSFPRKAFNWALTAAYKGNAEGQNFIAEMYESGEGVNQDLNKAIFWYQKSAQQNFANAQINLADKYIDGRGVEQNLEKARSLLSQAKLSSYARGKNILKSNNIIIKNYLKRIENKRK